VKKIDSADGEDNVNEDRKVATVPWKESLTLGRGRFRYFQGRSPKRGKRYFLFDD